MKLANLVSKAKKLVTKRRIIAIVVLLIGFIILTRGGADKSQIKTAKVQKGDIVSEVFASGTVRAKDQTVLHFPVSGKVVWTDVKEGDSVRRGQAIASLDGERYEIALRQAQQDVVAADAELVKVYDDLKDGDDVESFDDKIKRTAAEAKKNKAFDNLKAAERSLKDTVLTSPIAGTVLNFNILPQTEIFPSTEIATIGTTKTLEFAAEVDETDVVKIKDGSAVLIALDAFQDIEIESAVGQILDVSTTTSTGATAYEVKMVLPNDLPIRIGMSGEATVEIEKRQNVITIPIEALVDDKYVYVAENGKYSKTAIETGLSSDTDIEIVKGPDQNQEVLTSGFDQIGKQSLFSKIVSIFK